MTKTIKQIDAPLKRQLNQVDASLPWRSSLEQCAVDMDEVQREVESALIVLTDMQRKFVLLIVSGSLHAVAYMEAGYRVKNEKVASVNAAIMLRKDTIQKALAISRLWHQLKFGISAIWKRQQLVTLYGLCTTPGSDTWNPNAANKSMQLLMSMDGDIMQATGASENSGVNIVINTGVPERIGQDASVLDHDTD